MSWCGSCGGDQSPADRPTGPLSTNPIRATPVRVAGLNEPHTAVRDR